VRGAKLNGATGDYFNDLKMQRNSPRGSEVLDNVARTWFIPAPIPLLFSLPNLRSSYDPWVRVELSISRPTSPPACLKLTRGLRTSQLMATIFFWTLNWELFCSFLHLSFNTGRSRPARTIMTCNRTGNLPAKADMSCWKIFWEGFHDSTIDGGNLITQLNGFSLIVIYLWI